MSTTASTAQGSSSSIQQEVAEEREVESTTNNSWHDNNNILLLPTFDYDEITLGRLIGRGGFSTVREIRSIALDELYNDSLLISHREDSIGEQIVNKRIHLVHNGEINADLSLSPAVEKPTASSQYVLKTLRNDLSEEEYSKGMVDLSIEIEFLTYLQHPNIIAIRGISTHHSPAVGNSYTDSPTQNHNFIILDRLTITLDMKFKHWKRAISQNRGYYVGPLCGYCCSKRHVLEKLWQQRIQYMADLAHAVSYLHEQQIIYRDIKPDNIGFNQYDQLKLFDFGLAKNLKHKTTQRKQQKIHDTLLQKHKHRFHSNIHTNNSNNLHTIQQQQSSSLPVIQTESGLFLLTGNTGSLRYMAPEVALGEPYNLKADVYSFGILFWQMCALQTPYSGFTTKMHAESVVRDHVRPPCDQFQFCNYSSGSGALNSCSNLLLMPPKNNSFLSYSSSNIHNKNRTKKKNRTNNNNNVFVNLMQDCWNKDLFERPDFKYITFILEQQLDQIQTDMDEEEVSYVPNDSTNDNPDTRKIVLKNEERIDNGMQLHKEIV